MKPMQHFWLFLILATTTLAGRLRKNPQPDEFCKWIHMKGVSFPYYAEYNPKKKAADYWDYWAGQSCYTKEAAQKKCIAVGGKCSGIQTQTNECNKQFTGEFIWTLRAGNVGKL